MFICRAIFTTIRVSQTLLALSSKMMVFAACLLDTVPHLFVMLLSQEYTSFFTNTASRLLMVCMVVVDNTAEIIQKFIFSNHGLQFSMDSTQWRQCSECCNQFGIRYNNAFHSTSGLRNPLVLKSYLTAFFFNMCRCTCRCDSHMLHTTLRYAQNSHAVEATCI